MKKAELGQSWTKLGEEAISGMLEWRQQHPKASLREIEREVDTRLAKRRARMLADAAQASESAEWEKGEERAPRCPRCGVELEKQGRKRRKMQTVGGQELELTREYGTCPQCGEGIFPLDEELELLPGELTPCGQENLVRLSAWMPFRRASEILNDLLGIQVSKQVGQACTEKAGAAYVQLQTEAVERLEQQAPRAPEGGEKMQISADGAMVPLRHGVWAEVRTLVVGEVGTRKGEVHTQNLTYFSRKESAEAFNRLALVEIHRRGIENAVEVAAVMDGAEWEQGFTDHHCPKAVRILDFSHAAEHLAAIGASVYGENTPETHAWLKERLDHLKRTGPDELLSECRNLQQQYPDQTAISSNLAYLEKRRAQMQYPQFQAQGWPIGSGVVESANKVVVEARLKGAGMHWADQNVNPLLALRNIICSDRWNEEWPKIEKHLRRQIALKRRKRTQERAYQKHLQHWQPIDQALLMVVPPDIPTQNKPNPWRNFKHGKALFQRTSPPKI